jgi:signal peptidase I
MKEEYSNRAMPEQTEAISSPLKLQVGPVIEIWRERNTVVRIPIKGNSMAPLIRSGDYVTVRAAGLSGMRPGDVVVYLQGGGLIVHRLVKKRVAGGRNWFCQKGDNLKGWGWIEEKMLFGRVESIEKNGRILHMGRGGRYLLNRLIGSLLWCWVTVYEAGRKALGYVPAYRLGIVLQGMLNRTAMITNRVIQRAVLTFMSGGHGIGE